MRFSVVAVYFMFTFTLISTCTAAQQPAKHQKPKADIPDPTQFITKHKAKFNGEPIAYTAIVGETYLRDIKEQPTASIFTFGYIKSMDEKAPPRPVTFIWNGGPGSASTWLHMGGYGPKRIILPSDAQHAGSHPYDLVDAPETILDVTDLVFIDPVGTGFSRALGEHEGKEFWGLKEDAESMALFIKTWLTENNRWNSPRFLLGESYGTTRAAAVAKILEADYKINLSGIIFISQALDYQGSTPYIRDNMIAHVTYLPTMAATALYHGKITPAPVDQQAFLQEAREFATQHLLPALFQGNDLSQQDRSHISKKLAYYTGLSTDYIEKANLRIQASRFAKELLRDKGMAISLLDGRYTQDEIDDLASSVERDAGEDAIGAAYIAGLMSHMRNNLNVTLERQYLAQADPDLSSNWRYRTTADGSSWEPAFVNTARDLSTALRINPGLKVFIASGYFDLVTPFFDAQYTLKRHDIDADTTEFAYYQGGHMMYVHEPSRLQLLKDTRRFVQQQIK